MDLQYLLLLQQFRESAGELMTSFMMLVTNFAMFGSAVLCVIIFWTVDKVLGQSPRLLAHLQYCGRNLFK